MEKKGNGVKQEPAVEMWNMCKYTFYILLEYIYAYRDRVQANQ